MSFLRFLRLFLVSVTLTGLIALSLNAQNILKPDSKKNQNVFQISPTMTPFVKADNVRQFKTTATKDNLILPRHKTIVGNEVRSKIKNAESVLGGNSKIAFDKSKLPGEAVGFTYYDFQTNGAMPERLAYYYTGEENMIQMFWMTDEVGDKDWTGRGTYYEMIDFSTLTNQFQLGFGLKKGDLKKAQGPAGLA